MTYSLSSEIKKGEFSVPNIVTDKHLRLVSGEQLKVLLLILRNAPKMLTKEQIAKSLKYDLSDVEDYLQYWILTGVLVENNDEDESTEAESDKGAKAENTIAEPKKFAPSSKAPKAEKPVEKVKEIEYSRPTPSEIATRMEESPEISKLFRELQLKLGKTISYDGQCVFLLLFDRFGLSTEVIYMLVDYCVSIGKTGYSYIEAVGKNWGEEEIDTIEKAAEKIEALANMNVVWKKFTRETGLTNPKPTKHQLDYFDKWVNQLKIDFDLLVYAYEKSVENTGKFQIKYMNTILEDWHKNGYKTMNDVEVSEQAYRDANKKDKTETKNENKPSYDLDKFQKSKYKKPVFKGNKV